MGKKQVILFLLCFSASCIYFKANADVSTEDICGKDMEIVLIDDDFICVPLDLWEDDN